MKEDFMIAARIGDFVEILYRRDWESKTRYCREVRLKAWDTDLQQAIDFFNRSNSAESIDAAWIPANEMPKWAERPEVTL